MFLRDGLILKKQFQLKLNQYITYTYGVFKKGLLEEENLSLTSTFSCNSQIFSGGHKYFFKVIKSKPAKIT